MKKHNRANRGGTRMQTPHGYRAATVAHKPKHKYSRSNNKQVVRDARATIN